VIIQKALIVAFFALLIPVHAISQTFNGSVISTTLIQGDASKASNRVNIVFFGDGYQASQAGLYDFDINEWLSNFFKIEPFSYYQSYFNVYKVTVASNDTDVTQCNIANQIVKHTYFSTTFGDSSTVSSPGNCKAPSSVNPTATQMMLNASALDAAVASSTCALGHNADNCIPASSPLVKVVLANSVRFGGTGTFGQYMVFSPGSNREISALLSAHELGHSFAYLWDEYPYNNMVICPNPTDIHMNVGTNANPDLDPWSYWEALSNTPKGPQDYPFEVATVGAYLPSGRCSNFYHPTPSSLMHDYDHPFYQVNTDAIIDNIYAGIMHFPDGRGTPSKETVSANVGDTMQFSPAMPFDSNAANRPQTFMSYNWSITDLSGNQTPLTNGVGGQYQAYNLDTSSLQSGTYMVSVDVVDNTPALSIQQTTGTVTWNLNLSCPEYAEQKSINVVSYTDPVTGDSCTQKIATIDQYDCKGNIVSESQVPDTPICVDDSKTCVSVSSKILIGPTFEYEKQQCHNEYDSVDYECSDGSKYTTVSFRKKECTSAKLIIPCPVT